LEKEMKARARVRDLELYVAHLEQYDTILHEKVHRLHDLMNPNHQPQAVEDDVGAVVVPGGEEDQRRMMRRILKKLNPCWKVGRRQVTSLYKCPGERGWSDSDQ
jgi:hypothetical protein